MLLPFAAALALVSGQTQIDLVGTVRLATEARSAYGQGVDSPLLPFAIDLSLTPSVFASLTHAGGNISLTYSPTFRLREPYDPAFVRPEANNFELLSMSWYREGRPRPYLTQSFSYGTYEWASLLGQVTTQSTGNPTAMPTVNVTGVPGSGPSMSAMSGGLATIASRTGTFDMLYFDLVGGVAWPLSRLVTLDTQIAGTYGGGTDFLSQQFMPTQTLARGRAQLDVLVNHVDTLMARTELTYVNFSRDQTILDVFTELDATGRWRRLLLPYLTSEVVAGASAIRSWPGDTPRATWSVVPIAQGLLSLRALSGRHGVSFDASVGAAPFIDRYNATVYERFDTAGALIYSYAQVWQFALRGGVGQSLTQVNGTSTTTGILEGRASYVARRIWRMDLTATNSAALYGTALINTWFVALSLTLRAEGTL